MNPNRSSFRVAPAVVAALLAAAALPALAQSPAAGARAGVIEREQPVKLDSRTQRVEHIRVEDAGSRVDEVRAGGETKSISVQPKNNAPQYEVQPQDTSGSGGTLRNNSSGSTGNRVWKVLNF